ncbi:MAG: hypothetical protein RLZZ308_727 [Candidatus Parcubacteria bacterium]|jgi:preprotein translocase subunit SecG
MNPILEPFYRIDNKGIQVAWWCTRQIELFTLISHQDIGATLLWLHIYLMTGFWVIAGLSIINLDILSFFFVCLILLIQHDTKKALLSTLENKKNEQALLPKEIKTRFLRRIIYALWSFIILISLFATFFEKEGEIQKILAQGEVFPSVTVILFCFLVFLSGIMPILSEYYMCTSPLPPGEKGRKTYKRVFNHLLHKIKNI